MDPQLSTEELEWLRQLHTDTPVKPEAPEPIAASLLDKGLAIRLVEGGLQLTALGRERLAEASA